MRHLGGTTVANGWVSGDFVGGSAHAPHSPCDLNPCVPTDKAGEPCLNRQGGVLSETISVPDGEQRHGVVRWKEKKKKKVMR